MPPGLLPLLQTTEAFLQEFDAQLQGRTSRLIDYSADAPRVMAAPIAPSSASPNPIAPTPKPSIAFSIPLATSIASKL